MTKKAIISEYLKEIAARGGKARAARHSKTQLSKWAKLGGRPRKHAKRITRTKQSA